MFALLDKCSRDSKREKSKCLSFSSSPIAPMAVSRTWTTYQDKQFKLLICCQFLLVVSSDILFPSSNNENSDQLYCLCYLILSCTPHHDVHREVEPSGILWRVRSRIWRKNTVMNFFARQLLAAKNERKADLAKIVALQVKLQDCIAHIGPVDHVAVGQRNTRKQKKNKIPYWCMGNGDL